RYRSLGAYRYYGAAIERGKIYQMDVEQLVDGHRIPRAFHYFVDYRDWFFCLAIMPEDQSEYSGQQTEVAFLIRADQYPR
ncbi:MAG TPA: hypothetical protein VJB16_02105, partial [archaeon]|nr:hypothetical protein [archaeon]